jgi:DNA-directed RNA polymerase specialized sigma24 family protein
MKTETPAPRPSAPTDADLIAKVRKGEMPALRTLVSRHQDAAVRLARRLAPTTPAELVSDAVTAVSTGLQAGAGPKVAFRPHLLTTLKRLAAERGKGGKARPEERAAYGVDPLMHAAASKAFRALPENQQVALWHTGVDGAPLLDTGLLLGVTGTEVAELDFAARQAIRAALVGPLTETITSGPCRWTVDRLSAHVRGRLTPAVNEKVADHVTTCGICTSVLPAVRTVETEMALLIASVVLGSSAPAYLGLVAPAQARRGALVALAGGPAYLLHHGKAAAFVGLGGVVLAGGLIGGLNMVEGEAPAAANGTFNIRQGAPEHPIVDSVAESGSGVSGGTADAGDPTKTDPTKTDPTKTDPTATPTPQPLLHPNADGSTNKSTTNGSTSSSTPSGSAKSTKPGTSGTSGSKPESHPTLHLGFTNVSVTPGHGLLWLFSFGSPDN